VSPAVLLVSSLVVVLIYAHRLDALSWWRDPRATSSHVLCGAGAAWSLAQAGQGVVDIGGMLALLLSVLWLWASYEAHCPRPPRDAGASGIHIDPLGR